MLKKRCTSCDKKIERKFNFCPWCGHSFRQETEAEDFGMLGQEDEIAQQFNQMKLPFGLNGIMNGLIKQLEKEMGNMNNEAQGMPRGFKIQISTGNPQMKKIENSPQRKNSIQTISAGEVDEKEKLRRSNLERVEAKSVVRRLPEGIFYEIEAPGIKSIGDVVVTKLEESMEIKAYSKDKCYVKSLPIKLEIISFSVKNDKVLLRLKG